MIVLGCNLVIVSLDLNCVLSQFYFLNSAKMQKMKLRTRIKKNGKVTAVTRRKLRGRVVVMFNFTRKFPNNGPMKSSSVIT